MAVQRGRSEVRDAMNKERQVCAGRRDGEPAVSRAEASHSYPPAPRLPGQTLFPWGYVEGLTDARTKLADFFSILLDLRRLRVEVGSLGCFSSGVPPVSRRFLVTIGERARRNKGELKPGRLSQIHVLAHIHQHLLL